MREKKEKKRIKKKIRPQTTEDRQKKEDRIGEYILDRQKKGKIDRFRFIDYCEYCK